MLGRQESNRALGPKDCTYPSQVVAQPPGASIHCANPLALLPRPRIFDIIRPYDANDGDCPRDHDHLGGDGEAMAVTEESKTELSQHSPKMPPAVVSSDDSPACSGVPPSVSPTGADADCADRPRGTDAASSDDDSEDEDESTRDYLDSLLEDGGEPNRSDPLMRMRGFNPQLKSEEEKSWTTLDSVHSRASTIRDPVPGGGGSGSGSLSGSLDSSSDSFASFGASNGGLEGVDDLDDDLRESQAEFMKLEDAPKRNLLLSRSSSVRMKRGPSFRGTLSLISESALD